MKDISFEASRFPTAVVSENASKMARSLNLDCGLESSISTTFKNSVISDVYALSHLRQGYPNFGAVCPWTLSSAMIIGPSENSPRSVRSVRARR